MRAALLVGIGVTLAGCARDLVVRGCDVRSVEPVTIAPGAPSDVTVELVCSQVRSAGVFGLAAADDAGAPIGPVAIETARELPGLRLHFTLVADALASSGGAAVIVVRDDDGDDTWYPVADAMFLIGAAGAP